MDAVCIKGGWDVILERNGEGKILGLLVYHSRKLYGFNLIMTPLMTAYTGVYLIFPKKQTNYDKGHFTYKHTQALIDRLPKHSLYYQQYHTAFQNWLSFYWNGYKQTTRYTYIVDTTVGKEKLWAGLKNAVKKDIVNAEKVCNLVEIDMITYLAQAKKAFGDRNRELPADTNVLMRLYDSLNEKGLIQILAAQHKETGDYLSAQVVVHDKDRTYGIACYYKKSKEMRTTLSYVIWHLLFADDRRLFDFEGSIIKGVERYIRSFGGTLTPHYRIHKVPNPILRLGINLLKPNFFG